MWTARQTVANFCRKWFPIVHILSCCSSESVIQGLAASKRATIATLTIRLDDKRDATRAQLAKLTHRTKGSGCIRKVRWAVEGKGESGGVRIIYYWDCSQHKIYLLTAYGKSEQANIDNTTLKQIAKALKNL